MRDFVPKMFIIRFMLYASTCRLISVLTCFRVLIWKCVYPIHDFSVPNGCSDVSLRVRIRSGSLSKRASSASSTSSCSQRVTRLYSPVVHSDLSSQRGHAEDQYLSIICPFSSA